MGSTLQGITNWSCDGFKLFSWGVGHPQPPPPQKKKKLTPPQFFLVFFLNLDNKKIGWSNLLGERKYRKQQFFGNNYNFNNSYSSNRLISAGLEPVLVINTGKSCIVSYYILIPILNWYLYYYFSFYYS